jgi:UDP-glucuronate 4-epimerase
MKILVTGCAGFIGFHLVKKLITMGHEVVGLDNLNHYYDVRLKLDRLAELGIDVYEIAMGHTSIKSKINKGFEFKKLDLITENELFSLFEKEQFDYVFNLAAQAGVRYSIENPKSYVNSNLVGFANLMEACRRFPVKHLVYASSSSVYGSNKNIPFKTSDNVDHPISFYAATKKCNELMAHSYSHLFKIPTTGLRFFTVYGEWGRPDMATMLFAKAIMNNQPIKVFNNGDMSRDFTYVGDVVEGLVKVMAKPPVQKGDNDLKAPYEVYNIGNSKPVNLMEFIKTMESILGKEAEKIMYPLQQGDVKDTYADVSDLIEKFDYQPKTSIRDGLTAFANWYLKYYHDKEPTKGIKKSYYAL